MGAARCSATPWRAAERAGYDVTREYYVNDAGKQVATLARSASRALLQACGATAELPEDGYPGEYLRDLMRRAPRRAGARDRRRGRAAAAAAGAVRSAVQRRATRRWRSAARRAAEWLLEQIKDDMRALAVEMDSFVSERRCTPRACRRGRSTRCGRRAPL
jgi:arginyl-tRNA synthetase